MDLTLRDLRRISEEDRYFWLPFEPSDDFKSEWWDNPSFAHDSPHFVQALLNGEEVARVELDHGFEGCDYPDVPELGEQALEIQLIEVSKSHRRRHIGTAVVQQLMTTHPDRRLLAFSKDADEFWASFGWDRFDYPEDPPMHSPLFIQPERAQLAQP